MSAAVESIAAARNFSDLDRRFINAVSAAVGDSGGDDAALGQDVRVLFAAFSEREAELTRVSR